MVWQRVSGRGILLAIAAVIMVGLVITQSAGPSTAEPGTPLSERLDALLADPVYDGSQVALLVRDAATGETLYDRNGGQRMLPASNTKLFTSTAAMEVLGPDFRFHTDVLATAPLRGGTLRGDLYLKGYGDPTAREADYQALAEQLRAAGVRHVDGDLVADDSYFDQVRLGDSWAWDDEQAYYAAQISALTLAPNDDYDTGTAIVESRPGASAGAPVRVGLVPANRLIKIVNTATTGAAGSESTLNVEREHGGNVVRVSGSLPLDAGTDQSLITVWEPEFYAADVFRLALEAEGIEVDGKITAATTPAKARRLAEDKSMTVGELMTPFLKLSNNIHAETLIKTMGAVAEADGSWPAGLGVVSSYAQVVGVEVDRLRISDGSGLTRKTNLTADAITDVLIAAQREPWWPQWYDGLPIAGKPERLIGGTLRTRMLDTPAAGNLRGKTGTLTGVSALSGYVTTKDGRKLVFSMISNNQLSSVRAIEDAVGVTLASWTDQAPVAATRVKAPVKQSCESEWEKAC
ncbi:D-alanyl-D-alanine carboxypeptidase/D-alanyl-D-alanine-endopeptidase [Microlunatus sp. GCM10028923]|uniref:D-alanyl-D-alanine carboxypeptidase/D-alanyl-D-alanine endopeptidase n=1 Tax=Microlunatus sp. GCM10028923 TaxID=3273400 RepID=UPI0036184062